MLVSCWFHAGFMPDLAHSGKLERSGRSGEKKKKQTNKQEKNRASRDVVVPFIGVCCFMSGFMYGFMSGVSVFKRQRHFLKSSTRHFGYWRFTDTIRVCTFWFFGLKLVSFMRTKTNKEIIWRGFHAGFVLVSCRLHAIPRPQRCIGKKQEQFKNRGKQRRKQKKSKQVEMLSLHLFKVVVSCRFHAGFMGAVSCRFHVRGFMSVSCMCRKTPGFMPP